MLRLSSFVIALALAASAQAAGVYKYVDKDGRVHYGDKPQAGWTRVEEKLGTAVPRNSAERQEQAARAEKCDSLKKDLETWRAAPRLVERSATGDEHEFTPEERSKLYKRQEEQIATACAPPTT